MCKNIHLVKIKDFEVKRETDLNIAYTHETRKKINQICMERNLAESNQKPIFIKADQNNPKTQDVRLIRGMPIICHRTNKKLDILNSDRFYITSVTNKEIWFNNDDRKFENGNKMDAIIINTKDFHKFFYLAYCITSHASQGETFREPYTIYDWKMMNHRARYVSLSRGTEKKKYSNF